MKAAARELWTAWQRRRDSRAFEDLVRPELRYAADFARRMGASRDEAQDLVQQSLLRLAEEKTDGPVDVGVRAWLCRRVSLGFKMHVRSAVRRRRHEGTVRPRGAVSDPARRVEVRDRVEEALGHLDLPEREAVILRYLHDLDYREIAHVLGISESACRLRVHRALKRLRSILGPRAAALVAVIGVPALAAEAAIVTTAVGTAAATGIGAAVGAKIAAAVVLVTAAAVTIVATSGSAPDPARPEPASPPAVVARPPPTVPSPPVVSEALRLLADHFDGTRDASPVLESFVRTAALFPEPRGDPIVVAPPEGTTDIDLHAFYLGGSRLQLGPGRFRIVAPLPSFGTPPMEIRGAGKDETVLVAPLMPLLRSVGPVEGLQIRDLTFEGYDGRPRFGGCAIDSRKPAAVLFDRVRFRHWTPGGYGAPIGFTGRTLLALKDCEFVGGYRRVARGNAVNARGDVLAVFESCSFSDMDCAVYSYGKYDVSPRSAVVLRNCRFANARLTNPRFVESARPRFAIRVRGPTVAMKLPDESFEQALDAWGGEAAEMLEAPRVTPAPVRSTLADLLGVLDARKEWWGERVVGVQAIAWEGGGPPRFAVQLMDGEGKGRVELRGPKTEGYPLLRSTGFAAPHFRGGFRKESPGVALRRLLEKEIRGSGPDRACTAAFERNQGPSSIGLSLRLTPRGPIPERAERR